MTNTTNLLTFASNARIDGEAMNALRFIIESIDDGSASLHDAIMLDDETISEFGETYDFGQESYGLAIDVIQSVLALKS